MPVTGFVPVPIPRSSSSLFSPPNCYGFSGLSTPPPSQPSTSPFHLPLDFSLQNEPSDHTASPPHMTLKLPPQPKARRATACHRHPSQPVVGLCAHCLRERLSLLDPSGCTDTSSSNLISRASITVSAAKACDRANASSSSTTVPDLRRCKTFSGNQCESIGFLYEPRRRSCEVRGPNTLSALFNLDDESNSKCEIESKNLGLLRGTCPVLKINEEEEQEDDDDCDEIRASKDVNVILPNANAGITGQNVDAFEEMKTIKEYIDLEFKSYNKPIRRDFKEIRASVFSRKLRKWRGKHSSRRPGGEDGGDTGGSLEDNQLERLRGRGLRDTQSEVGEYVLGRRPCDIDPRFSVDLGRESVDDGRISVDLLGRRSCDTDSRFSIDLGMASVDGGRTFVHEARCSFNPSRTSWDGYFTRTMVRGTTPMVSVIENAMASVYGFDNRALVEEKPNVLNGDGGQFGGSGYVDSVYLQMQGNSFDRVNSKTNMVVTIDEETNAAPNDMVSPPSIKISQGTKLLTPEGIPREDDASESFESASKDVASGSSNGKEFKKGRQWSKMWAIWGLLLRQKKGKCVEENKFNGGNAGYLCANSAENIAIEVNGKLRSDGKGTETKYLGRKKDKVVPERNRSASYSPSNLDNGLLRFYLTPLKSYRRSKAGKK
ncbi:hypothetical protein Nepgr_014086 [Nepenthes gracilis]|uniref:Uncharacterized protein n=1 Tax=Nepenthes gracilis TaxID=150966 RepID=A0AAD3SIK8_NEPGR|nr:hypothetical protein Nepgr_014086 [Nepenthes gracilis]